MTKTPSAIRRYADLQEFVEELERRGSLKRIARPVSLVHEVTEIHRRVLAAGGRGSRSSPSRSASLPISPPFRPKPHSIRSRWPNLSLIHILRLPR